MAPSFSIPYVEICESSMIEPKNECGTEGATTVTASVDECHVCGRDKTQDKTREPLTCDRC